jgi:hypothetical protein
MKMKPAVRRRVIWAILISLVLIVMVVVMLTFVDATATIDDTKRCAPSIWQSQWPKYIGCTMAAHEGLAGGLLGAAGALFAAWLAFDAIQEQLAAEREHREQQQAEAKQHREQQQAEAKLTAVVCIAPSIHAAAEGLLAVDNALRFVGNDTQRVDGLVRLAVTHVQAELERFTVRESVNGLGLDDRLVYVTIIGTLNVFVNISERPSPILGRLPRLQNQRDVLMRLHTYLTAFDTDLARVFARDSQTTAPAA